MSRLKCELRPDEHGPPQEVSTFIGPCSPTGMYRLDVHGPITPKALRNIIKQIELTATFLEDDN